MLHQQKKSMPVWRHPSTVFFMMGTQVVRPFISKQYLCLVGYWGCLMRYGFNCHLPSSWMAKRWSNMNLATILILDENCCWGMEHVSLDYVLLGVEATEDWCISPLPSFAHSAGVWISRKRAVGVGDRNSQCLWIDDILRCNMPYICGKPYR